MSRVGLPSRRAQYDIAAVVGKLHLEAINHFLWSGKDPTLTTQGRTHVRSQVKSGRGLAPARCFITPRGEGRSLAFLMSILACVQPLSRGTTGIRMEIAEPTLYTRQQLLFFSLEHTERWG